MCRVLILCGTLLLVTHNDCTMSPGTFDNERISILRKEATMAIGGDLVLHGKEQQLDAMLKQLKATEFSVEVTNPALFAPALHFFKAKDIIDASPIFKILQKMPKGGLLHAHKEAMVSSEWIIKHMTYRVDIMKCESSDGFIIFTFRKATWHRCQSYVFIHDERRNAIDIPKYDKELESHINLYTPTPESDYTSINEIWTKFENMFSSINDLINFADTWDIFHTRILQELYDDNVMYAEIREEFPVMYSASGAQSTEEASILAWKRVISKFKLLHPDFVGVKFIYSMSRTQTPDALASNIAFYQQLKTNHSDVIIGMDLIGQEDLGRSLNSFRDQLLNMDDPTKYFFHAGETDMSGYSTDQNLIDAIALNTSRIGHGYALSKHPVAMEMVKQRQICIEICPISNQVLKLVTDLRNHPASVFVSQNIPMVISNDDPGFWNAKGLSYDFYYAFMSMSSMEMGLAYLKQLALNSIKFSILTNDERARASNIFHDQWKHFINDVIGSEASIGITLRWNYVLLVLLLITLITSH